MHQLAVVLVPAGTNDIGHLVELTLSGGRPPYPHYDAPCSCLGSEAFGEGFATYDESPRGREIQMLLERARERREDEAVTQLLSERYDAVHGIAKSHPRYGQVDLGCDVCDGLGTFSMTRDPAHHTDWWVIGGRWSGIVPTGNRLEADLGGNIAWASEVTGFLLPGVVVSLDGAWHEGPMILVDDFKAETSRPFYEVEAETSWRDWVTQTLQEHAGCYAVIVDCHT